MTNNKIWLPNMALSVWQQNLLALTSGVLLSLSVLDAGHYLFAWIAFVPFLIAINGASLRKSYWLGFISGLAFCISAGYWVVDFFMLSKGYDLSLSVVWSLIFWLYCAQLNAIIALTFSWLKRRSSVHEFILFPLIMVTLYAAFPMLFTVRLGESQSQFFSALQAIEFTGVYGLDAIIALSNIMLFKALSLVSKPKPNQAKLPWLLATTLMVIWFTFGMLSMHTWDKKIAQWETIRLGIVQPNETPSLERSKPYLGFSRAHPPEMAMTERLTAAGAEIIIWPEAKYKAYFDQPHVAKAYQDQLMAFNTSLIFQDIQRLQLSNTNNTPLQYNTAAMLNIDGLQIGQYQKMKRIAFGEYVPVVSDIPILKTWIEDFIGKFLNEMQKGTALSFFEHQKLNIIPLICYEVMFPEFVAEAVSHVQANSTAGSLLVGLSSNGWFGTTRQPYQHVNSSILRAVENRLPLVHAVNNGPSVVALPSGRVIFMSNDHETGGYIIDTPYPKDTRGSFYSQHPQLFLYSVYSLLILIIVLSLISVRRKQKNCE
jgi:apolipoprotein N-acyltransferase